MPNENKPWSDQPVLRRFHEYWLSKHRDGRLPGRPDIDPLDIPDLMSKLNIVEVLRDGAGDGGSGGLRFRFRLVGTDHVEFNKTDFTGKTVDEVFPPEAAARINATYITVIETREPHYWRTNIALPGREHIEYERLICPLAADGETVDMLIGAFVFGRKKPRP